MAGVVADYKVIVADTFSLGADIDRTFEFELPNATQEDMPAVVSFMLNNDAGLRLVININGKDVYDRRHAESPRRAIQETVGSIARPGRNKTTFTANQVSAGIGDVVLWFQRD